METGRTSAGGNGNDSSESYGIARAAIGTKVIAPSHNRRACRSVGRQFSTSSVARAPLLPQRIKPLVSTQGHSRRFSGSPTISGTHRIVLQKSFYRRCQISEGYRRIIRVRIWGTSSPCAKFVGDFGSSTETMRIIDLFALLVFAKNLDHCKF